MSATPPNGSSLRLRLEFLNRRLQRDPMDAELANNVLDHARQGVERIASRVHTLDGPEAARWRDWIQSRRDQLVRLQESLRRS